MNDLEKCPNAVTCPILKDVEFVKEKKMKIFYKDNYCDVDSYIGYGQCKRYITKKALGFCPDFVYPDSKMTIDDIINKLEE